MKAFSGFELNAIPVDSLQVSEKAQRESSARKVEQITDNFQAMGFGVPLVNRRPSGELFILDGQHRVQAAKALGHTQVVCEVADGLTLEEEADLFLLRNNNLEVYAVHKFNIGVTAGHTPQVEISNTLDKLGMKVAFKATQDHIKVACVDILYRIYERAGLEVLSDALETAHEAYGQKGLKRDVLDGLAHVYANIPTIDID